MNYLKILNKNEKQEIIRKLKLQFGITDISGTFLKSGTERLFLFQGEYSHKKIKNIDNSRMGLERIGIYFAKFQNNEIRLSIEATHILKDQIKKNIFELNKEQVQQWMSGQELNIQTNKKTFLVMKHKEDFLGCGKASEHKISNFIPKSRRLKIKP